MRPLLPFVCWIERIFVFPFVFITLLLTNAPFLLIRRRKCLWEVCIGVDILDIVQVFHLLNQP
jgi:hypothetical protein